MDQLVPYLLAGAGAYLILVAVMVASHGVFFALLAKIVPILLGAACLWVSAMALVGGA
jgi:hypothetical protein